MMMPLQLLVPIADNWDLSTKRASIVTILSETKKSTNKIVAAGRRVFTLGVMQLLRK
jgi:flagellar motor protein MotB